MSTRRHNEIEDEYDEDVHVDRMRTMKWRR
jgi:hypothetical protein